MNLRYRLESSRSEIFHRNQLNRVDLTILKLMSTAKKATGSLRIIAGRWRRRNIRFNSSLEVRPTTDAARETLFNWLQGRIEKSVCLDLFAGSGALGFEALSRGAREVVLVDSNRRCIRALHQNAENLNAQDCSIVLSDGLMYLRQTRQRFDIVFVDPPFHSQLQCKALSTIQSSGVLNPDAQVYLEVEHTFNENQLLDDWEILRQLRAGSRLHILLISKSAKE